MLNTYTIYGKICEKKLHTILDSDIFKDADLYISVNAWKELTEPIDSEMKRVNQWEKSRAFTIYGEKYSTEFFKRFIE